MVPTQNRARAQSRWAPSPPGCPISGRPRAASAAGLGTSHPRPWTPGREGTASGSPGWPRKRQDPSLPTGQSSMRLELGVDTTQGHAQEGGVTMSIVTSWVTHVWQGEGAALPWGRQGACQTVPLPVPLRPLVLPSSALLSWPLSQAVAVCCPHETTFLGRPRHSPGPRGQLRWAWAAPDRLPLLAPAWVRVGPLRRAKRVWLLLTGAGVPGRGHLCEEAVPTLLRGLRAARSPSPRTGRAVRPALPGEGRLLGAWTGASACGWLLSPW